jgi:hypothetical protein
MVLLSPLTELRLGIEHISALSSPILSLIGLSLMMYLPNTCSSCWLSRQCCGSRFFIRKCRQ